MRKSIYSAVVILLAAKCCFAYTGPNPRNSNIKAGTVKLDRSWNLTFDHDYIAGDNDEDLCFTHSDMGLVYKGLMDGLELGVNYTQVYERTDAEPWKAIDRPHMNVTLHGQILALDVSSASRFEYRDQETQKDFWRYRNKFAVKFPSLLKAVKLQPYLAHDFFVDLTSTSDFARNGLSSGISFKLSRNLTGDFYYRWHTSRYDGIWYDYRILGTVIKIVF